MKDRTVSGVALLVIGFLGFVVFLPAGWMAGMMGGWGGMMMGWNTMMGWGAAPYGVPIISFLFGVIFLGIFFTGLYLVLKEATAT